MDNTNWLLIILLVLLIAPLRESLLVFLVTADPLILLMGLVVVWYFARD